MYYRGTVNANNLVLVISINSSTMKRAQEQSQPASILFDRIDKIQFTKHADENFKYRKINTSFIS